jgi:hypothetical protein
MALLLILVILTGSVAQILKNNMMKKIILFLFISFFFFSFSVNFLSAQEEEKYFEVDYPQIQEIEPVYVESGGFPELVNYMVYFLIALSVAITIFSLIRGGLSWLTAKGDPYKIKEGRERINGAIFGLIIILSSSLFLSSINPQLIKMERLEIIETEESFPPGIYLSPHDYIPENPEEIEEDVFRISRPVRNLEDFSVKTIRIANHLDNKGDLAGYYYAVLLHGLPSYRGRCALFVNNEKEFKDFSVPEGVSSVSIIQVRETPLVEGKVTAYIRPDFNENYPSQPLDTDSVDFSPLSINGVWSVDIDGKYAVVLASGNSWETTENGCGVFLDSKPIPDLKEHHMNKCNPIKVVPFFAAYESCSTHYVVFPLFR